MRHHTPLTSGSRGWHGFGPRRIVAAALACAVFGSWIEAQTLLPPLARGRVMLQDEKPGLPKTIPAPPPAEKPDRPPVPGPIRLPRMGDTDALGKTPAPTAKELAEYGKYVDGFVDPRNTLDLVVARTRLMILKQSPSRIQVADPTIAESSTLGPRQISLLGRRTGTTTLTLFFKDIDDNEKAISYLVRVIPDPEEKARLERSYKALEEEINEAFPNSFVKLSLVGDKLTVCGQAKDIVEGTQLLRLLRSNAPGENPATIPVGTLNVDVRGEPGNPNASVPGLKDFLLAGGPNIINMLRVPGEQQVMLRVQVAEVNRAAARSIGVNFNIQNNQGVTVFAQRTGNIALGGNGGAGLGGLGGFGGLGGAGGAGGAGGGAALAGLLTNNLPVNLDGGQIALAINALRELTYARSLAEPNLVASNGQTATFQAGGQFPVPTTSAFAGGALQGVQFVPYGVQLNFTPFITERDRIRLNVSAEVSTRDLATGSFIGGAGVPGLNTRNFQTTVELREGETMAVAGLIQNNFGSTANRVPFLGDIPVINRFFGYDQMQNGEQELVVLITPELVHPLDHKEVLPLPGSDLFEPSDLEFYVLGRLESRRDYDYRSPVRNSLPRMKAYQRMEDLYIFGPVGYSEPPPVPQQQLPGTAVSLSPVPSPTITVHPVPSTPGKPATAPPTLPAPRQPR